MTYKGKAYITLSVRAENKKQKLKLIFIARTWSLFGEWNDLAKHTGTTNLSNLQETAQITSPFIQPSCDTRIHLKEKVSAYTPFMVNFFSNATAGAWICKCTYFGESHLAWIAPNDPNALGSCGYLCSGAGFDLGLGAQIK